MRSARSPCVSRISATVDAGPIAAVAGAWTSRGRLKYGAWNNRQKPGDGYTFRMPIEAAPVADERLVPREFLTNHGRRDRQRHRHAQVWRAGRRVEDREAAVHHGERHNHRRMRTVTRLGLNANDEVFAGRRLRGRRSEAIQIRRELVARQAFVRWLGRGEVVPARIRGVRSSASGFSWTSAVTRARITPPGRRPTCRRAADRSRRRRCRRAPT